MDVVTFFLVVVVSFIAGLYGVLVGGGALISVPALIFFGLSPHVAVATNQMGALALSGGGIAGFLKKGLINFKISFTLALPTLIGGYLGARLLLDINEEVLKYIIAGVTLIILIFIMLKQNIGIEEHLRKPTKKTYVVAVILSFFIGGYGAFYGAGAGTFFVYMLVLLFGQTFLKAAATRQIITLCVAIIAVSVYAYHGAIEYVFAIPLFIGFFSGSYFGARYSDRLGNVWIKRMFFVIVFVMVIKLLLS